MTTQSLQKPALIPVQVPWRISTSDASLSVQLSEDRTAFPTLVDFVGLFAHKKVDSRSSAKADGQVAHAFPSFEETRPPAKSPYHLVRVVFDGGFWAQLSPSVSETHTVRDGDYDWSAVPTGMLPGEKVHENLERTRKLWLSTGICPDPGMYEVRDSPRLERQRLASQPKWKHYLLLGSDAYLEVLAQGWEWKLGQPLQ